MDRSESPRIFVPPPLIILLALILGLWIEGRLDNWPEPMLIPMLIGGVISAAGLTIIASALGLFRKAATRPEPWRPASSLVRGGVYRLTRNPMYLGMLLTHAGVALALQSLVALLLIIPAAVIIDRLVIEREEAYLERQFGAEYAKYRTEVRRWI